MTRNRTREAVRETDPADQLRADLRAIADAWPDLQDAILGGAGASVGPITGTPETALPGNWAAIQTERDVVAAAWFLARVIADETSSAPPSPLDDLPACLRWIATWRADWLARHPDLGGDVVDEWRGHARLVHRRAYPDRPARTIHVGVPCAEHGTDELGQRIPCPGVMTVRLTDSDLVPDMVCTLDPTHRISPVEWQRAARRGGYDVERIVAVLAERHR